MEKNNNERQEVFDDPILGLVILFLFLLQLINLNQQCTC